MKSFNRNMGIMAGIFFVMIVGSVSVGTSYIESNNLDNLEFWNETTNLDYSGDWDFDGIFSNKKTSDFDTMTINDSQTFSLQPELYISSSIEEITFVEENRNDIQVNYYREYPDTDAYHITYKADETTSRITVTTTLSIRNIAVNKSYDGRIEIRLPKGYEFDEITLESAAAKIESDNVYTKTKELNIIASFGDIDIKIEDTMETLDIQCSMGSVNINVQEDIDTLNLECNLGDIDLRLDGKIANFSLQNDMGDTNIEARRAIGKGNISASLGEVTGSFRNEVSALNVHCDMGSINLSFRDNDDMVVYADTDLGDVSVDGAFTISDDPSDFSFTSNLGSISIVED